MERKTDRRSLKTQTAIKKALAILLKEKPVHEITITELTSLADIHRATFYSHYEDILDLYRDFENDLFKDLTSIFENQALTSYQAFYSALLDYINENPLLLKAAFSNYEAAVQTSLFQDVVEYLISACKQAWILENNLTEITPQMNFFAHYRVHGIIALIGHWINSNYSLPLDEVKKMISELDKNVDAFILNY